MRKKTFEPMTLTHEALEMNQAVAGECAFVQQGASMICDNCFPAGSHTWTVYSNGKYGVGVSNETVWENDFASSMPAGAVEVTGECGKYTGLGGRGVQAGWAFVASDPGREGHWDPNGDGIHFDNMGFEPAGAYDYSDNGGILYNQNS